MLAKRKIYIRSGRSSGFTRVKISSFFFLLILLMENINSPGRKL